MKKRIISILMAAIMLMTLMPVTAFAANYTDTQGHWGEKAIDRWTDYNIVSGKGSGIFDPNGFMTRAEAAQVFANLLKLETKADLSDYTDVGLGKWYDDPIAKCISAGIMEGYGNGIIDPNGTITREMFFVMFCRALGIKAVDTAEININDAANVSNYAKGYITALVNKGYVSGTAATDNGVTVAPKLEINRASVMSLLNQTITTYVNTTENVTAGDGLTLVVADNAKVSFDKNADNAEVFVFGSNTIITDAPVGTVVTTAEDVTGTKVNGKSINNDTTIVVEKTTSSGGGSYTPPAPTTYTVTFDMQGHGTQIATKTDITSGAKIEKPSDPSESGYTFGGWYKDAACTNEWKFDTDTVTADTTLYAKWVITVADVLGTVEGGFPVMKNGIVPSGAWATTTGNTCFLYGSNFALAMTASQLYMYSTNGNVEKSGENYTYTNYNEVITFCMSEGVLTSIIVEGVTEYSGNLNGTYIAPTAPTFKAVYNTTGDANTLTFYYDAVDHSGDQSVVFEGSGVENYLFNDEKTNNKKWGYNGICDSVKSVVIDSSVENYSGLTSTAYMFFNMKNASSISGAEYLDVSNVTDMSYMFGYYGYNSTSLSAVPNVSGWNTAKVEKMGDVFNAYGRSSTVLNIVPDVSGWNTANVTTMIRLFNEYGYSSTVLDKEPKVSGSNWDTSKVTSMSSIFNSYGYSSESLNAVPDVSNWKTDNVTKMDKLFSYYGRSSQTLNTVPDVSKWNTAKVTDISNIFQEYGYGSTELTSVPAVNKWTTSAVTMTQGLFNKYGYTSTALNFTLDLSGWSVASVTGDQGFVGMFDDAGANTNTWSVTIPAKTGNQANDATHWYVGDGTDTGKYIEIKSENSRQFTLAKTIADILPNDFPTDESDETILWKNNQNNGLVMYKTSDNVLFGEGFGSNRNIEIPLDSMLKKVGDNLFKYSLDDNYEVSFNLEDGVLKEIVVGGQGEFVGTYEPATPAGNPNVFTYLGSETALDFANGTYGSNTITAGYPIVIKSITGNLSITGDTTGREIHAFVQTGGTVTSADSNGTIKAYIGGSENAEGTITAGTDAVANISLGTFTGVDEIIANTTGKISIGVSDYTKKIDLGSVNANIEITSSLSPSISASGALWLDDGTCGLFKNISSSDTLTYTAAAGVKKINGTAGNDIISMDDNAIDLIKIDLTFGMSVNDTVIVNEYLWKYDSNNLKKYEIDVKGGDKVKIGNAASCYSTNVTVDGGTDVTTNNINTAINGNASESRLFFFKFNFITSGESECYLVYDKDNNKALSNGDIVIQILGANSAEVKDPGYITFIGS